MQVSARPFERMIQLPSTCRLVSLLLITLSAGHLRGASFTLFGPNGEGGAVNGQTFTLDAGGKVFELDAFVQIGSVDLNGDAAGTSGKLSQHPLPPGLDYAFAPVLSADGTDVTLAYTFTNIGNTVFTNVQFFFFLDVETDESLNTFFNEYGEKNGVAGLGAGDPDPDSWEIDEPAFRSGDIINRLFLGTLENTNDVPLLEADDVALALGFQIGNLGPSATANVEILISEDGTSVGSISLVHRDRQPGSTTVVTLSGQASPFW